MNTNTPVKKKTRWILLICTAVLLVGAAGLGAWFGLQKAGTLAPAPTPLETPLPTPEPTPAPIRGYFPAEGDLFRPEDPMTRGELTAALEAVLPGVEPLEPAEDSLTKTLFAARLKRCFDPAAVEEVMRLIRSRGSDTVTRAEAVVCLNRLLGIADSPARPYFPDVAPDYWAYGAIQTAANGEGCALPLEPGLLLRDGWLHWVDEDGYFRKNAWLGSLFFDHTGYYTCGNKELDAYVAQVIAQETNEDMTPEEKLHAVYLYVRDNFKYFRRNYYLTGDTGWQIQEALTMYSTGRGNCYCYAAAFWAAARGLGFDAKIVSGTIGKEHSPHGWVEINMDGERHTFDVEMEMARKRDGERKYEMYCMSDSRRSPWGYIEYISADNMMPRETEDVLLPR